MKTHTLLGKVRSWRGFAFALLLTISAFAGSLSGLTSPTPTANAIDDGQMQKCYDTFNGRDLNGLKGMTLVEQDLYNQVCKPYCKALDNGGDVTKPLIITCPNPTSLRQIADAEMGPLVKLVCGDAPAGENAQPAYLDCADKTRAAYKECDNFIVPITGPVQDTDANTASCIFRNLAVTPKPSVLKIQTAVANGRQAAINAAAAQVAEQQQAESKAKCEADGGTWKDNKCNPKGEDQTTCAVEGIGWIVCPVMTFMSKLNDAAFGFLNNFLEIPAKIFSDTGTKNAWEAFRNFGNVAFVIAFLVIIYSQITGAGVSNYGVKKLLPKLIIAAVLVNVSFYVCGILVDLSNIVGSTLYDLLKNFEIGPQTQNASQLGTIWTTVGAAVLAAGAVVALIALVIFAPTTLLAFAAVILILIARQAFVVLLIVISPLAFVAYLLPNTESWFKRWWKAFTTVLMVYPIVSLIFGASTLAANVLLSVSQSGDDGNMMKLTAAALVGVPLLAVPPVVKGAIAAAGVIGAKVASYQDRANKSAARGVKEGRIGEAKTAFNARSQVRSLNRRRGGGLIQSNKNAGGVRGAIAGTIAKTGFGTYQQRFDESRAGQYFGGNRGAAAATAGLFHEYDEEVKRQKTLTSGRSNEELLADMASGKGSEEYQAAIAGTVMSRDHRASQIKAMKIIRDRMSKAVADGDTKEQGRLSSVIKQMAHDNKDKPFGAGDSTLAQMEEGVYGKTAGPDIYQETQTRIGTKLSEEKVAHMNPDDTRVVYELARNGHLTAAQLQNLRDKISDARVGRYKGDIKPESAAMHEEILNGVYTVTANTDPHKSKSALPAGYRPLP